MLSPQTEQAYHRLADWLAARVRRSTPCPVIGINGAQGSGKSTLAAVLVETLATKHGLRAALLSLDDFYLGLAARQSLAREVHPLLATRGVPGTHEVEFGISITRGLCVLADAESLALPKFSKARDDRLPKSAWPCVQGPFDVILLEGWCVGTPAQTEAELVEPINALEADHDADGRWRRHANAQLQGAYARWFAQIDALIFLQVPDFEAVQRWRWQQECDTAARAGAAEASGLMNEAQLATFIQHYERLTRQALYRLPALADALLELAPDHAIAAIRLS